LVRSSFRSIVSLHLGEKAEIPAFVRDFVNDMRTTLAGRGFNLDRQDLLKNFCVYPEVERFFEERRLAIIAEGDTD